jgi:BirA family biotin operon repressor/biotin-[acetyl-CoA-carboxylase] ligase
MDFTGRSQTSHPKGGIPIMNDRFTPVTLQAILADRPFRFYDSIGSTQDSARDWALSEPGLPGGAVVIAEEQTAGRGRQGRGWISPPGASIMCSVVLRPDLPPERLPRLVIAGGIAVAETLDALLPGRVRLKWPNDVLIQGRKVCGVLAEAAWIGEQLGVVILGIGINVRVSFEGTPLTETATSLESELGRTVDRHTILADLLSRVDHWAGRVQEPDLIPAWRAWLGTLGKRVTVYPQFGGESYPGVAEAVEEDGALLVRCDSGELRRVFAAEVGLWEES